MDPYKLSVVLLLVATFLAVVILAGYIRVLSLESRVGRLEVSLATVVQDMDSITADFRRIRTAEESIPVETRRLSDLLGRIDESMQRLIVSENERIEISARLDRLEKRGE